MRFTILYHGKRDGEASSYDEAHRKILERNSRRRVACGFYLHLKNYEVVDNWEEVP